MSQQSSGNTPQPLAAAKGVSQGSAPALPPLLPDHIAQNKNKRVTATSQNTIKKRTASTQTHCCISFKNKGIRACKNVFLRPESLKKYELSIPEDARMNGTVTEIPSKDNNNYRIEWDLSSFFYQHDTNDLQTTIFKTAATFDLLKASRIEYDSFIEKYSSQTINTDNKNTTTQKSTLYYNEKEIKEKRKKSKTQQVAFNTTTQAQRAITNLRMTPVLFEYEHVGRHANIPETLLDESESEDGSNILDEGADDTYLPRGSIWDDHESNDESAPENENRTKQSNNKQEQTKDDDDNSLVWIPPEDLKEELQGYPNMYENEGIMNGPALKRGIATKFNTALEACGVCGGMDFEFFKRLTANSNEYGRNNMDHRGYFGGSKWKNISTQEMIRWHGVILKMSIDNRKIGGYESYFSPPEKICLSSTHIHTVNDFPAWAAEVFTIRRFKQIRAAYHPEVGFSTIGDKCHQLRHTINALNEAAKRTFIPGQQMSFDEGGIPSRSRMNPVRMYNQSKPDKYRVELFVLANSSGGFNFVMHLDVYQGKNEANIGIPKEICHLPTTQKALVNSVLQSKGHKEPN